MIYTDPKTGKFAPGNPGGGRPKGFSIVAHLKEQLQNVAPGEKESEATLITRKYIQLAKAGDQVILKDLINRVDGLAKGDLGLGEGGGITFNVRFQPQTTIAEVKNNKKNN